MEATQPGFHEQLTCMPREGMERVSWLRAQEMRGLWNRRLCTDRSRSVPQIPSYGSHPGLCIIGMTMGKLRPWLALFSWLSKALVQMLGLI